jgi:hypothetical protein
VPSFGRLICSDFADSKNSTLVASPTKPFSGGNIAALFKLLTHTTFALKATQGSVEICQRFDGSFRTTLFVPRVTFSMAGSGSRTLLQINAVQLHLPVYTPCWPAVNQGCIWTPSHRFTSLCSPPKAHAFKPSFCSSDSCDRLLLLGWVALARGRGAVVQHSAEQELRLGGVPLALVLHIRAPPGAARGVPFGCGEWQSQTVWNGAALKGAGGRSASSQVSFLFNL